MCDIQSGPWIPDLKCSPSSGVCFNGECVCKPGFEHDLSLFRFRDCRIPSGYLPAIDGIVIAFSALSIPYSLYYLKQSRMLARKIILSAIFSEFFCMMTAIIRFIQSHMMTGTSIFFFLTNISFAFLCAYLSAYSLAAPLFKISKKSIAVVQNLLVISFIIFRVIIFSLAIAIAILANNPNDSIGDNYWNLCIALGSLALAVEMLLLVFGIIYQGDKMIFTMAEIAKDVHAASLEASTNNYIARVKRYLRVQKLLVPVVIIVAVLFTSIYFATGYLPYSFVLVSLIQFSATIFALALTHFAVINKLTPTATASMPNPVAVSQKPAASVDPTT